MEAQQLPLFVPQSDWVRTENFPDFSRSKYIGLDVETKDPNLKKRGPGGVRKDGYICGVTLATEDQSFYFPINHPDSENFDRRIITQYLKQELSRPSQPKIGAHLLYDLEWISTDLGIQVEGPFYDILLAEPLLNENERSYNLDRLSEKYLGQGKEYAALKEATLAYCGPKAKPRESIWKLPAEHVGAYAEADGILPIQVFLQQKKMLEDEGLWDLFMLETDLIPMLLQMRLTGVRVDIDKAEQLSKRLRREEKEAQKELDNFVGLRGINVWSGAELARAFDNAGEWYPKTLKGAPSFEQDWLKSNTSKLAQMILRIRKLDRLSGTFVESVVLDHSVNGRIHCQFHQLRSDDGGTVSGRFSSSNPNLQQIPARDDELAPLVRGLFIPEEGCDWVCDDFSQIEPRLQVHYAVLRNKEGAQAAADMYRNNPATDFHQMTADITKLERKPAKTIHLGLSYGLGIPSLAANLGVSPDEAKELKAQYSEYMPFLEGISRDVNSMAAKRGFIRTLLGRKARFDKWEPAGFDRQGIPVATREEALEKYGPPVRRADTRKAFNRLIQGSAADVMKKAMVTVWKSGICQECPIHLTVHDEDDHSVPKGRKDLRDEIRYMMETCVDLQLPLKVDCEIGPSWGEVK